MDDLPHLPKRPERLFFCIFPDSATCELIMQFARRFVAEHQLEGTLMKSERAHLSLQHVGDYGRLLSKSVYAARLAGNLIATRPIEITFRFLRSLGHSRPKGLEQRWPLVLVGEGEGLFDLHKRLGAAMEKYGLRAGNHFLPHITLHYGSREISPQNIEPIRCVVRGFALVHSELWRTRYHKLAIWPQ